MHTYLHDTHVHHNTYFSGGTLNKQYSEVSVGIGNIIIIIYHT